MPGWSKKKTKTPTAARRRPDRACAVVVAVGIAIACARGAEYAVIEQFFSASRLRDLTALEKVSTVIFEPRQDGTVLAFEIVDVHRTGDDSEELLVSASVRLPSGQIVKKPLLITLKRQQDRWMVAAVRVSTESTSPASRRR